MQINEMCRYCDLNYYLLSSRSSTSALVRTITKPRIMPRAMAAALSFGPDPSFDLDSVDWPAGVSRQCGY